MRRSNYSDWIELYNPAPRMYRFSGWGQSDNKLEQAKWTFRISASRPAGMSLYTVISRRSVRPTSRCMPIWSLLFGRDVVLTNNLGVIVGHATFSKCRPIRRWAESQDNMLNGPALKG